MKLENLLAGYRGWMAAALVVGLAAAIRTVGLDDRPFWLDEAFSAWYARLDLATLCELRRRGTNPPLYHLLLAYWADWFGLGEAALRSLSVLAGTAAVALIYVLGRSISGPMVGLTSAILLAVSTTAVGYSQEARYYAILELLAIVATLLLRRALLERGGRWMIGYAFTMSVFVWMHTYAWFVLAAHVVTVAGSLYMGTDARQDRRALATRFGLAIGAVVVSFLPWVGILVSQVRNVLDGYWMPYPHAGMLVECTHGFVVPLAELRWPVVAVATFAAGFALVRRRRTHTTIAEHPTPARFDRMLLWLWATLPIAIPLTWSLVGSPIFQPKYALASQPAMLILLAMLIRRRPTASLMLVVILTASQPAAFCRGLQLEDWRHVAELIDADSNSPTPVYVSQEYTYPALVYYLDAERHNVTSVVLPNESASELAVTFPRAPLAYAQWLERLEHNDRAWVVLSRVRTGVAPTPFDRVLTDLERIGSVRCLPVRGDVDVLLWKARGH